MALHYLIIGRSGTGKSSLVNSVFGHYIAETAEFEACTRIVRHHADNTPWGDLVLIDTPGFAEGGQREDEEVTEIMATHVDIVDVAAILLVSRLDETRMRPDELRMINLLTKRFGQSFWHKAWLMLTFSASVPPDRRDRQAESRQRGLAAAIRASLVDNYGNCSFSDFRQSWLVDNVVRGWTDSRISLDQVLSGRAD